MPTMTRTSSQGWIALLAAVALAVVVALVGLNGTPMPAMAGPAVAPGGHPEVVANAVPAYVSEAIVYGEAAPGATGSAQILPAYMVESIYYGEMEPPSGA